MEGSAPRATPDRRRVLHMKEDHTSDAGAGPLHWVIDSATHSLHLTWTLEPSPRSFISVRLSWRHLEWLLCVVVEVSTAQWESLPAKDVLQDLRRLAEARLRTLMESTP